MADRDRREPGDRQRLDALLVERDLARSRTEAHGLVLAGRVRVDGLLADKPGRRFPTGAPIEVSYPAHRYASRGGLKLEKALDHFEGARWLIPHSHGLYLDDLGFTKTLMRRFDEAETDFNVAISLDPRVGSAYFYKARVFLGRDGDVDAAKQVMREMSSRVGMADALESWNVSEGTSNHTELRVMPDEWAELWNAFERDRIERYRSTQPSKVAVAHLSQAVIIEAQKGRPSAIARYDSARVHYERIIRSNPKSTDKDVATFHVNLGLAYAGLGRCEEAIREGEEAVRIVPVSRDALTGAELRRGLSEIYMMCGEYEATIDEIETLLAVPSSLTVAILRIDPIWDPIRTNPRFRRLVEGK